MQPMLFLNTIRRQGNVVLLMVPLCFCSHSTAQTSDKLTPIRAALDDRLFDMAREKADVILQAETVQDNAYIEAERLKAQALIGLKRFEEAARLLIQRYPSPETRPPGATYWLARAYGEQGRFGAAMDTLKPFHTIYRENPLAARALRMEIYCHARMEHADQVLTLHQEFDKRFPEDPEAADNLLEWAGWLIKAKLYLDAQEPLKRLIERMPQTAQADRARLWMSNLLMDTGHIPAARNMLTAITSRAASDAEAQAEAWFKLAQLYESQNQLEAADEAMARGVEKATDPEARFIARIERGKLFMRANRTTEALRCFEEAAAERTLSPKAGQVQLEVARLLLDHQLYAQALNEYQQYLEAFLDPEGLAAAQEGKATALGKLNRHAEAASAFEKASQLHTRAEDQAQALFQSAKAHMAAGQWSVARAVFARVAREYPQEPIAEDALAFEAECLLQMGLPDEAFGILSSLASQSKDPTRRATAEIKMGKLDEDAKRWDTALARYERVHTAMAGTEWGGRALYAYAGALYSLGRYDESFQAFARVQRQYPNTPLAEQSAVMRGLCLFRQGRAEEAVRAQLDFLAEHPTSPYAADALFWLGEQAFNRGEYSEAEKHFTGLAGRFPQSATAVAAWFWAGRAAMEQKEYLRAMDSFNRLTRDFPDSPLIPETRFAQGEVLSELGQFDNAIVAFDEIITKHDALPLVDAAWGRKGDCQFALGQQDAKRYDEAYQSYRTVLESTRATPEIRLQAEYKMGRCREKSGRGEDALRHYLNVVYNYLQRRSEGQLGGSVWFTRAAFDAAALKESAGDRSGAARIYQRVTQAGVAASAEAAQRAARLQNTPPPAPRTP